MVGSFLVTAQYRSNLSTNRVDNHRYQRSWHHVAHGLSFQLSPRNAFSYTACARRVPKNMLRGWPPARLCFHKRSGSHFSRITGAPASLEVSELKAAQAVPTAESQQVRAMTIEEVRISQEDSGSGNQKFVCSEQVEELSNLRTSQLEDGILSD